MTRVYELENDEFSRIVEGFQTFIILKDDKIGIKSGDVLILQFMPEEEGATVMEATFKAEVVPADGLKKDFVACQLSERQS